MDSDFHKMLLDDLDEIINNPDEFGGECIWQGKKIRFSNQENLYEGNDVRRMNRVRQILCNPRDFSRMPCSRDLITIDGEHWVVGQVVHNTGQYVIFLTRQT